MSENRYTLLNRSVLTIMTSAKLVRSVVIITAALFCISAKAQGNLQFNAVKFYELSVTQVGSTTATESTVSITVPVGKVWKIESAVSNSYDPATGSSTLSSNRAGMILINGKIIFQSSMNLNYPYFSQPILPMWLPAGTYTLSIKSSFLTNGAEYLGAFSAIEFNVVP